MELAIVGTGYVGLTTGACFASLGNRVTCYDIDTKKVESLRAGHVPIFEPGLEDLVKDETAKGRLIFSNDLAESIKAAEAVFVCVPTPTSDDGQANLMYLENSVREIAKFMDGYKVIVEKSTSPAGTALGLKRIAQESLKDKPYDIAVNPEFLREGSAIYDFMNPDRIAVGVENERAQAVLARLYEPFTKRNVPICWMDLNSAEIVKHVSNWLLAQKIASINVVARLCDKVGGDISKVADAVGLDKRIGRPFLDAGLGYGGSCFPKDVAAFRYELRKNGVPDDLPRATSEINESQVGYFVGLVDGALRGLEGKTVGLFGLSFKPNTDDMREARSIPIIRELHRRGAVLRAFDPKATQNAKAVLENPALPPERRVPLMYCVDPYEAAKGSDGVLVVTEWDTFKSIDLKKLRTLTPCVIDGRNIYSPRTMQELGFVYRSIGRP